MRIHFSSFTYDAIVDRALGANSGVDPMGAAEPADLVSLAVKSYRFNGNLDIEMLLDESASELLGEFNRWTDL